MISVYGSSGFVGSEFCRMFPDKIIEIPKEQSQPESNELLYLISTVHNYNVHDKPFLDIDTNLTKLVSVLVACRERQEKTGEQVTINFVSSWFVYGANNEIPVKESDPCEPMGFYSITKYAAERLLISYCKTFNMKYRIFRLGNVIGKTATKVSIKRNALQYLIKCLVDGEDIKLYNKGSDIRDFIHVSDCCDAINCCIGNGEENEIFNISNSIPHSIGELLEHSQSIFKTDSNIEMINPPEFHKAVQVKDMLMDNSKLISCGYEQKIPIKDAILDITKDYLNGN
jgi:nucleoside-diphosphate-sugar epimerase